MWLPEEVVSELCLRGDLWQAAPGLVGMRGRLFDLARDVEMAIAAVARAETGDEWRVPSGIAFDTLETAQYFASFPQWLTAASHLSGDEALLEQVATSASPGASARQCMSPASAALSPAVCYHTYAALAGCSIDERKLMTAEATCWRHEGERFAPWREAGHFRCARSCLSARLAARKFRQRGMVSASALAASLGIETAMCEATDPFSRRPHADACCCNG